jgi:hypothetical protein
MLKLGSGTGSLMNHLDSRSVKGEPAPYVGMGATLLSWSDRHAGTIVEVFKKKDVLYIKVQEDNSVRIDKNGMSESQEYEYSSNPNGQISYFRKVAPYGFWQAVYIKPETGRFNIGSGGIKIGVRDEYYDFSF